MKVSPHTHPESHLTGSTVPSFIARAKELGRTHFAFTDHGHLSSVLAAYSLCKPEKDEKKLKEQPYLANKLQLIAGMEIYFKDPKCPFTTGTPAERCKYFTGTIYCRDQEAYQALCKMASRTDMPTIEIYEEKQQLWSWADLEEIAKYNTDFVASGPHCMVAKPMLAGAPEAGQKIFLKLKEIFEEDFFVALLAEPWTKRWQNVIEIKYQDGTHDALLASDLVTTDKARKIKALDLTEKNHHAIIKSKMVANTYYDVNKPFTSVKLHKGFLPLPGGDVILKNNKFLLALAGKYRVRALVTDYAYYAEKEDKIVQTMRLEGVNKLHPNLHMKSEEEIVQYLTGIFGINELLAKDLIQSNEVWAKRFDGFTLKYDWRLATPDGDPMQLTMESVNKTGRMRWDDPVYVTELKEELQVIAKNGKKDLLPYFLPICGVKEYYKENGALTGPLRGSCGGSLLCYVMGITDVNPFKYDLPFNRFFSMDRINSNKLPDIDSDLADRTLLIGEDGRSGYLYGKYGNKVSQISTRNTIRLKTAIKDANRYLHGSVEPEIEALTKGLPAPQQGVSDYDMIYGYEVDDVHVPGLIETSQELKAYIKKRPQEWAIVERAMGITRAFGVHAAAFVLSDEPIRNTIPLKDGNVAQYDMKAVEAAGLIKYDFLVVSQLKDIEVCLNLINKKNGKFGKPDDAVGWYHPESDSGECADCGDPLKFLEESNDGCVELVHRSDQAASRQCDKCHKPMNKAGINVIGTFDHNGEKLYIWDLPELDEVFKSVWDGSTETIFQINTKSMTPFVKEILPKSIEDLGVILALVRPGPLDFIDEETGRSMAEEYCVRRKGESGVDIPILGELVKDTYGIMVYQESLTKIAKELAGFPGDEAEKLRENMGKKKMSELQKMKPKFIEGASRKVDVETAEEIWERMVTFGRYGFNKSHSIGYALITYACMFLKHFYPLEWWAAVLTNADEKEITGVLWPYVKDMVLPPDINLSTDTMVVDYQNGKLRSKLGVIRGIGEATIDPIVAGRPYASIQDFVDKDVCGDSLAHKLIHVGVLDSLFPPRSTLLEKLKLYQNAVEIKSFREKSEKAKAERRKIRQLQPKEGVIPEEYLNLDKDPLKEAAMKKSVLASMAIDLFALGRKYSKVLDHKTSIPTVINRRGDKEYRSMLINGEKLRRLDELEGEEISNDIYVASTCFVVQTKEFTFAKNTKRALKLILDADGYVSEKVLWPDYDSGQLVYPPELKRGKIVTCFFRKKPGKKDMSIQHVVIET